MELPSAEPIKTPVTPVSAEQPKPIPQKSFTPEELADKRAMLEKLASKIKSL